MTPQLHLKKIFLKEGLEDYFGLWSFFRELDIEFGIVQFQKSMEIILEVLLDLLGHEWIQPGLLNKQGMFEKWSENGLPAYEKIVGELNKLGREPNINEICWFETTEIGRWVSKKTG